MLSFPSHAATYLLKWWWRREDQQQWGKQQPSEQPGMPFIHNAKRYRSKLEAKFHLVASGRWSDVDTIIILVPGGKQRRPRR
jgi:hypothetical protein